MTTPNGTSLPLPPTVNLHIVGHCNFACRFCYARFVDAKEMLPWPRLEGVLAALSARGVRRVTFAGGEPTLHPDLLAALRRCADLGLVTSVVTNGSVVGREWCRRHLPWLRWLVLSCDSPSRATCDALGRRASRDEEGQPARVLRIAETVHEWNRLRPERDHVRLKINMVVTAAGAQEDPTAWLARVRPARVKLLQALLLPGENEDAVELACSHGGEQGRVASPEDVPRRVARPDCLVFLDVPEPVRRSRLRGRAGGATGEERRLDRDAAFRERVVAGYRALGADFVPATGSPAQIADEILRLLRAVRRG